MSRALDTFSHPEKKVLNPSAVIWLFPNRVESGPLVASTPWYRPSLHWSKPVRVLLQRPISLDSVFACIYKTRSGWPTLLEKLNSQLCDIGHVADRMDGPTMHLESGPFKVNEIRLLAARPNSKSMGSVRWRIQWARGVVPSSVRKALFPSTELRHLYLMIYNLHTVESNGFRCPRNYIALLKHASHTHRKLQSQPVPNF